VPPDAYSLSSPARPFSLPAGTYRLHAYGNAQTAGGVVPYDVASSQFTVVSAPLGAASTAVRGATSIAIQAVVGGAPGLRALRPIQSDGDVPLPGPYTVVAKLDDGTTQSSSAMPDANGNATVTVTGAGAVHVVSVVVSDAFGNGGTITVK
jgi:hypothetical protein